VSSNRSRLTGDPMKRYLSQLQMRTELLWRTTLRDARTITRGDIELLAVTLKGGDG
jgi:hypothetical protein